MTNPLSPQDPLAEPLTAAERATDLEALRRQSREMVGEALADAQPGLAVQFQPRNLIFNMKPDVDLPRGWNPVGAVTVLCCIDLNGARRVLTVYAGDVMAWEAAGMLAVAVRDNARHLDAAPEVRR